MDLAIAHISFLNFRSYEAFDLDGIGPLTVLVGPNAAGKTNVVEGIGLADGAIVVSTCARRPIGARRGSLRALGGRRHRRQPSA